MQPTTLVLLAYDEREALEKLLPHVPLALFDLVSGGNKAAVDRLDDAPAATTRNPDATSSVAAEQGAR